MWHGLIFVRKGYYRKAIFPFTLSMPSSYPADPPSVTFPSLPFHPLISPSTGCLTLHPSLTPWSPSTHLLLHVLAHIKKAFYHTQWWADPTPPTPASTLYRTTRGEGLGGEFVRRVERSVRDSVEGVWGEGGREMRVGKGGGPRAVHERVWERVQERWRAEEEGRGGETAGSYLDWFLPGVAALGGGGGDDDVGSAGGGGAAGGARVAVTAEEEREWMEEERRRRAEERAERIARAVAASEGEAAHTTSADAQGGGDTAEERDEEEDKERERPPPVHVLDEGDEVLP